MVCKKKNLSLFVGTDGNIRLSGNCFRGTSAKASVPAKTVTLELDIPICTYNQWKVLIFLHTRRGFPMFSPVLEKSILHPGV